MFSFREDKPAPPPGFLNARLEFFSWRFLEHRKPSILAVGKGRLTGYEAFYLLVEVFQRQWLTIFQRTLPSPANDGISVYRHRCPPPSAHYPPRERWTITRNGRGPPSDAEKRASSRFFLQSFNGQCQGPPELVFAIRIGSSDVTQTDREQNLPQGPELSALSSQARG